MIGYAWNEITVSVTGAVRREIRCEKCGSGYAFVDEQSATCEAYSAFMLDDAGAARVAREDAEKKVQRLLASEVGAVPCPHCGWYQRSMLRAVRKGRYRWMRTAAWNSFRWSWAFGIAAAVLGAAVGEFFAVRDVGPPAFFLTLIGCVLLAIVLPVLRWVLGKAYDPNRAIPQEERKATGRRLSAPPERLEVTPDSVGPRNSNPTPS